ncbi:MAG: hypothetical protein WAL59_19425, partial [Roseiarcus sp.]
MRDAIAHSSQSGISNARLPRRPASKENAEGGPHLEIVIAGKAGERIREGIGLNWVSAHHFKITGMHVCEADCAYMGNLHRPPHHVPDEQARAVDLTQRPKSQRQVSHRCNPGVMAETESEIAVPVRIENRQRLFQVAARVGKISRAPGCYAICPMSDDSLGRMGLRRDAAQEGRGVLSH